MAGVMTGLQLLGLAAVLIGVALALPLPYALITCGTLVLVAGTAGEFITRKRPVAPSDPRSGPKLRGVG